MKWFTNIKLPEILFAAQYAMSKIITATTEPETVAIAAPLIPIGLIPNLPKN